MPAIADTPMRPRSSTPKLALERVATTKSQSCMDSDTRGRTRNIGRYEEHEDPDMKLEAVE
jgi:hypothetical protein